VKQGRADHISTAVVTKAVKWMKAHKAAGMSRVVVELRPVTSLTEL